jgi:predicted SAM-dependent methyltransferase
MRLHLGCFDQPCEGWYNTDITPHIRIARIPFAATLVHALGKMPEYRYRQHQQGIFRRVHFLDVNKPFPFPDNSVECAFCSHLLEHLHPITAARMFAELLRVLKPGGIFRVVVPDLAWAITLYNREDPREFLKAVFEYNEANPKNRHQYMYTDQSLRSFFLKCGFVEAQICTYRVGRLPDLEKMDNRPENSIYVEGAKPSVKT